MVVLNGLWTKSHWRAIERFYKNSNVLSQTNECQSSGSCLEEFTKEQKVFFFIIYSRTWLSSYLATTGYLVKNCKVYVVCIMQKQPFRGVLRKRSSGNMLQIYRRTPVLKCDFNKVALLSCKFAAYFQNTFSKEQLWVAASDIIKYSTLQLSLIWINTGKFPRC